MSEHDEAFAGLYRSYYGRLVVAVRMAGADPQNAEDLVQEAFAVAYGRWARVSRGTNPAGYVYRVALRLLRRRAPRAAWTLVEADASVPSHEEAVVTATGVADALEAMPPRRRACAGAMLYLGLTSEEAGRALGLAPATVRVQVHEARKVLRAALEDEAPRMQRSMP